MKQTDVIFVAQLTCFLCYHRALTFNRIWPSCSAFLCVAARVGLAVGSREKNRVNYQGTQQETRCTP